MNSPREGNGGGAGGGGGGGGGDDASLQTRFHQVVRGLVVYLQARHQLFLIEGREASEFFTKKLVLSLIALVFLVVGYGLFLVGAVMTVSLWSGMPWHFACLLAAAGHLFLGVVFLRLARRRPKTPLFEESTNELAKDREWLSNPRKPWK